MSRVLQLEITLFGLVGYVRAWGPQRGPCVNNYVLKANIAISGI